MTSAVPRCRRTRVRDFKWPARAPGWSVIWTSSADAAAQGSSSVTSTSPRADRRTLDARRCRRRFGRGARFARPLDRSSPASAPGPQTPQAARMTESPTRSRPDHAVPVTTVPTPARENTRSIGIRKASPESLGGRRPPGSDQPFSTGSAIPAPVLADTASGGSKSIGEAASRSATSLVTSSSHSRRPGRPW